MKAFSVQRLLMGKVLLTVIVGLYYSVVGISVSFCVCVPFVRTAIVIQYEVSEIT